MSLKQTSKLLLVLITIFSFNSQISYAGGSFINEVPGDHLASYFDLRQRSTQVQVTNTSSVDNVTIHVQIFADSFECEDRDFTDTLTPNETHVYDISNLVSANGNPINFQIPDGSHGWVYISAGDGMGNPVNQIIGNFRIVDVTGYEYRVNSATGVENGPSTPNRVVAKFSTQWGANQADILAQDFERPNNLLPDGTIDISVDIRSPVELFIFDDEETGTSCGEIRFGCDEEPGLENGSPATDSEPTEFTAEFINQGINDTFPNSRGGGVLCPGDFNTEGYVHLSGFGGNLVFIGYVGLNDGASRGSMDRFKYYDVPE